jgi:ABC-2 type transport system ATP-binding protein
VFFSSHIISEVEVLAERVAIIRDGVIAEESSPQLLTEMAMRRVKIRFFKEIDSNFIDQLEGVKLISSRNGREVIIQVEGDLDRLIKTLADYPVKDIENTAYSLEEIFLKYNQTELVKG